MNNTVNDNFTIWCYERCYELHYEWQEGRNIVNDSFAHKSVGLLIKWLGIFREQVTYGKMYTWTSDCFTFCMQMFTSTFTYLPTSNRSRFPSICYCNVGEAVVEECIVFVAGLPAEQAG